MTQGTYVQFTFDLPCAYGVLKNVEIVFWQENNNAVSISRPFPITKTLRQCSQGYEFNQLVVTLSREETLRFSAEHKAYMRLSAQQLNGKKFISHKHIITIDPAHDDSMQDDTLPTPYYEGWIYLDDEQWR
jgi:hypothetical protein